MSFSVGGTTGESSQIKHLLRVCHAQLLKEEDVSCGGTTEPVQLFGGKDRTYRQLFRRQPIDDVAG